MVKIREMHTEDAGYPSAPPMEEEYPRGRSHMYPDLDEDNPGPPPAYDDIYDEGEDDQGYTRDSPTRDDDSFRYRRPTNYEGNWLDDAIAFVFTSLPYYVALAPLYLVKWLVTWLILKPLLAPFYMFKGWYTKGTYAYEAGQHYFPAFVRFIMWGFERLTGKRLTNELGVAWDEYRYQWRHTYAPEGESFSVFSIVKSIVKTIFWFLTVGYVGGQPPPLHNRRPPQKMHVPPPRHTPRRPEQDQNGTLDWIMWIYKGGLSKQLYQNLLGGGASQGPNGQWRPRENQQYSGSPGSSRDWSDQRSSTRKAQKPSSSFSYFKPIACIVVAFVIYYVYNLMQEPGQSHHDGRSYY